MITEQLTWHEVTERLPDDNTTVLICVPCSDEPVWLGYHEDGRWLYAEGFEAEGVVRWANMPHCGLPCEVQAA